MLGPSLRLSDIGFFLKTIVVTKFVTFLVTRTVLDLIQTFLCQFLINCLLYQNEIIIIKASSKDFVALDFLGHVFNRHDAGSPLNYCNGIAQSQPCRRMQNLSHRLTDKFCTQCCPPNIFN